MTINIEWVSDYILTSAFKVKVGLTPVHCGHTCVQAGWTDVCPPWTLSCPTWFFSVILSQKEMIFLKDISQHNWSFNSLIFGNFIFSNFSNIYSGVGQTPVQPGQACVRWTIGCPCQGSQYWQMSSWKYIIDSGYGSVWRTPGRLRRRQAHLERNYKMIIPSQS